VIKTIFGILIFVSVFFISGCDSELIQESPRSMQLPVPGPTVKDHPPLIEKFEVYPGRLCVPIDSSNGTVVKCSAQIDFHVSDDYGIVSVLKIVEGPYTSISGTGVTFDDPVRDYDDFGMMGFFQYPGSYSIEYIITDTIGKETSEIINFELPRE
jgi:hypothetical protein